jgi:prepilin-type N-terminal cleavage/methylation domain-containing protein
LKRGFSLLELLVSMAMLGVLTSFLFGVFAHSTALFKLGNSRGNLQAEMRRLIASLGRELTHTSFYSLAVQKSLPLAVQHEYNQTIQVQRDALSCAALKDPMAPSSYNSLTGFPNWDCYTIYFASNEVPYGKLIRLRVDSPFDAAGPNSEPFPLRGGAGAAAVDYLTGILAAFPTPGGATPLLPDSTRLLTKQLMGFDVSVEAGNQLVRIRLVLRGDEGRITGGGKSTAELLEGKLVFKPENTWPRL